MTTEAACSQDGRILLDSRLAYHLRCLREDVTDPERSSLERLVLVRDQARSIWEIREELEVAKYGETGGHR